MINRNLLIGGDPEIVDALFNALGIAAEDRDPDADMAYLEHERNGASVFPAEGDFSVLADVWLWQFDDDPSGEQKVWTFLRLSANAGF